MNTTFAGHSRRYHKTKAAKSGITASLRLLLFLLLAGISAGAAGASQLVLDFDGKNANNGLPEPWVAKHRTGRAEAGLVHDNGSRVLRIKCIEASFSVERDISVSPGDYPYLLWEWKATKLPSHGDVRMRGRNDQGLQVLVAFENRKVISYIWDSTAPEGTVTDESIGWPIGLAVKVIVVRSGESDMNQWVVQKRNIFEDYEKMFHEKPSRVMGVRLQANTQYTKDSSEGYLRRIVFSRAFQDLSAYERRKE